MRKRAFTLIELLVVIAILAAILFPVFAKAREKGRQASCQSNEKQLVLGILQYVQDYDERFPGRLNGMAPGEWHEEYPWRRVIQPYVQSTAVMRCPSNPASSFNAYGSWPVPRSYAVNGHDQYATPMRANNGQPIAVIKAPANCILLTECSEGWTEMNLDFCWEWFQGRDPNVPCAMYAGHMGMANFAFCDGHVKPMRPNATVNAAQPLNMWAINGPNVPPFGDSVNQLELCTQYYNR